MACGSHPTRDLNQCWPLCCVLSHPSCAHWPLGSCAHRQLIHLVRHSDIWVGLYRYITKCCIRVGGLLWLLLADLAPPPPCPWCANKKVAESYTVQFHINVCPLLAEYKPHTRVLLTALLKLDGASAERLSGSWQ